MPFLLKLTFISHEYCFCDVTLSRYRSPNTKLDHLLCDAHSADILKCMQFILMRSSKKRCSHALWSTQFLAITLIWWNLALIRDDRQEPELLKQATCLDTQKNERQLRSDNSYKGNRGCSTGYTGWSQDLDSEYQKWKHTRHEVSLPWWFQWSSLLCRLYNSPFTNVAI